MLNPTLGHVIAGTQIDDHRFLARVPAAQLFQIAPDPRDSENKKMLDASKELQDINRVREEVQRNFEGAKKKNVAPYAQYIVAVHQGDDGITPPITLYCRDKLHVENRDDGTAFIQVPWETRLVAIDGETQLAARHEAANIDPTTKTDFVAVYVCHGKDAQWARQCFHDLNTFAVRPNAAISIGMDARDPITRIAREVERKVDYFTGRVNKVRRQLRSTDLDVVTISALRGACVTFAKGINGVQYGSRPVPFEDVELDALEECAVDWFRAVTEAITPALEDRESKLAATPAVLAAIGALGHQVSTIKDGAHRRARCRELASSLQGVDWHRGKHWEGIAGKFTAKGAFAVGGSKENAYAIYSALADSNSPGYTLIRGQRVAA